MIIFALIVIINALLLMLSALNNLETKFQKIACILDFVMIVTAVIVMLAEADQI